MKCPYATFGCNFRIIRCEREDEHGPDGMHRHGRVPVPGPGPARFNHEWQWSGGFNADTAFQAAEQAGKTGGT